MSDTPRTDACWDNERCNIVIVMHARQLERELTEVTQERDHLKNLIMNFCANQKWAAESWKAQKHVKPLFNVFKGDKNNE